MTLRKSLVNRALAIVLMATLSSALGAIPSSTTEPVGIPTDLAPIPRPDLSAMDSSAREKVEALQANLETITQRSDVRPADLAEGFGFLGQLFHAFKLLDGAGTSYQNSARLQPEDPRWPYYLALVHHAKGELDKAVENYDRALRLQPGDLATLIHRGNALLELDRSADAASSFASVLDSEPDSAAAHYGLGRAAALAGDDQTAVSKFERTLALDPEASAAHYQLAQAYRRLGNDDLARQHLAARGQQEPKFADPLGGRVSRLTKTTAFEVVLAMAADSEFSERDFLGFALSQLGQAPGVIEQLRAGLVEIEATAENAPQRARVAYVLGGLLVNAGRDDDAIQAFESAIGLDPSMVDPRVKLGNAHARAGRMDEARRQYSSVLSRDANNTAALLKRAAIKMDVGEFDSAIGDLDRLLELDPELTEAHMRLGSALARNGQVPAALERFKKALELDLEPRERTELHYFSAGLLRQEGRNEEAIAEYRQTLLADDTFVPALSSLARMLAADGQMGEAIELYGRWTELEPDNVAPRLAQATAMILAGRFGDATSTLEAGLEVMPQEIQLKDVLARHLAACPDLAQRDGARALVLALAVYQEVPTFESAESVAMAYAAAGQFQQAVEWQQQIVDELSQNEQADPKGVERLRKHLELYQAAQPCCAPVG